MECEIKTYMIIFQRLVWEIILAKLFTKEDLSILKSLKEVRIQVFSFAKSVSKTRLIIKGNLKEIIQLELVSKRQ